MPQVVLVTLTADGLRAVPSRLVERAVSVVNKAAFDIEAGAKRRCPVRTGNLRASITTVVADNGLQASVGTSVHYAPYVELGTRRMAPRPYLLPAAEQVRPAFVAAMRELLR